MSVPHQLLLDGSEQVLENSDLCSLEDKLDERHFDRNLRTTLAHSSLCRIFMDVFQ